MTSHADCSVHASSINYRYTFEMSMTFAWFVEDVGLAQTASGCLCCMPHQAVSIACNMQGGRRLERPWHAMDDELSACRLQQAFLFGHVLDVEWLILLDVRMLLCGL